MTPEIIEARCPLIYCDAVATIDDDTMAVGIGSDLTWRQTCAAGHNLEVTLFASEETHV